MVSLQIKPLQNSQLVAFYIQAEKVECQRRTYLIQKAAQGSRQGPIGMTQRGISQKTAATIGVLDRLPIRQGLDHRKE